MARSPRLRVSSSPPQDGALSGLGAHRGNATNAVTTYADGAGGAVYTGLAVAANAGATQLYAADFRNRKIDIFNNQFAKLDGTGKFVDATLPADYCALQHPGADAGRAPRCWPWRMPSAMPSPARKSLALALAR